MPDTRLKQFVFFLGAAALIWLIANGPALLMRPATGTVIEGVPQTIRLVGASSKNGLEVDDTGHVLIAGTGLGGSGGGSSARVTTLISATTFTCPADNSDVCEMAMSGVAGTLTVASPATTTVPSNGQRLRFNFLCTNVQTFAWDAVFTDGGSFVKPRICPADVTKPLMVDVQYNAALATWSMASAANGEVATYSTMVVRADTQAGGDAGIKIAAAIAKLPATIGGIVDATHFINSQNMTGFTIPPGVTVNLSPVLYSVIAGTGPIIVNQGARLIGAGRNSPGSTTIKMSNNGNVDVIKCINSDGLSTSYWHHGELRNLRIDGNKANNTTGNGVSVYSIAETGLIQNLNIFNAAEAGMLVNGSQSGTGSIENVTVNTNGLYGVRLTSFRSAITFKNVGGDNNPTVYSIHADNNGGSILLIDPKSEATSGPVIRFSGATHRVTLTIVGGNFLSPSGAHTAIQIDADNLVDHNIQIMGLVSGNTISTLIDDLKNGTSVATANTTWHSFFTYTGGGQQTRIDETGFSTRESSAAAWTVVAPLGKRALAFEFGAPGGAALTASDLLTSYFVVPFACTLSAWNILADNGTATIAVWRKATGTALPTSSDTINTLGVSLSTGSVVHSAIMTDFTSTAIVANDILAVNVSAAAGAGYIAGSLECLQ